MHTSRLRARRGFTILEMVISMSLMLAMIGLSVQLFRRQGNLVAGQSGRLDAQQNNRYALGLIERELRMAGVDVADAQPIIVQAAPLAITFNSNLVSNDTGDYGAVYVNPDADSASAGVLRSVNKITLPLSTKQYPDTTYMENAGVPSHAETISYWLAPDTTVGGNANDYALYRRVNNRPARVIAHGIQYHTGDVVFQYYKIADSVAATTTLIPAAKLPLLHTAMIHSSPADTGQSGLTDSIKIVKVTLTSLYHDPKNPSRPAIRTMTSTIHVMNAGLVRHVTCGEKPIAPSSVNVNTTAADGVTVLEPFATISWNPSTDEKAGEKDVERYAIFRRIPTAADFGEPFASIAAGDSTTYKINDTDVSSGQVWVYGVAALDCTPASSPTTAASQVTIP